MKIIGLRLSYTTVYLIPCNTGYFQIDTGYSWEYPRYLRLLSKAGVSVSDIRHLFLTHHHDDHSGFIGDLTRAADLTVIAHEEARSLLRGGRNDSSRGGGYVSRRIAFLAGVKKRFDRRWTQTFPPFDLRPEDITVSGDDPAFLRTLGIDGTILATPGHSVDHLAIVLDSGEAFCGDAAARMLLWTGTHYCTVFMTDLDQSYESWRKMASAGARTLYPAHGRPFPVERLHDAMGRVTRLLPPGEDHDIDGVAKAESGGAFCQNNRRKAPPGEPWPLAPRRRDEPPVTPGRLSGDG
jgi:hydroxyacylglutathione hydrolase